MEPRASPLFPARSSCVRPAWSRSSRSRPADVGMMVTPPRLGLCHGTPVETVRQPGRFFFYATLDGLSCLVYHVSTADEEAAGQRQLQGRRVRRYPTG